MIKPNSRILILAPHTDDAELGMGATINKFVNAGMDVYCVAFSACEQSTLPQFPSDILITETKKASLTLGIIPENLILFQYNVRTFNYHRQDILNDLLKLRESINPDVVFIPSLNDVHQDHGVVAHEAVRAFKHKTLMCYELPWNNIVFTNTCYSVISEGELQKKVEAIGMYQSQAHRDYASAEYIQSLARTRGVQIGKRHAECFEMVRFTF